MLSMLPARTETFMPSSLQQGMNFHILLLAQLHSLHPLLSKTKFLYPLMTKFFSWEANKIFWSSLLILFSFPGFLLAQPPLHPPHSSHSDFIEISVYPNVKLDKRYATTNNFCNEILDTNRYTCSLHPIAAEKFLKASQ